MNADEVRERLERERETCAAASLYLYRRARYMKVGWIVAQVVMACAIAFKGGENGPWLGLLLLIPTVLLGLERSLAIQDRSGWHYNKRLGIDRLLTDLAEGEDPATIQRRFWDLDQRMADTFPQGTWQ